MVNREGCIEAAGLLINAFDWNASPEGFLYWKQAHGFLRDIAASGSENAISGHIISTKKNQRVDINSLRLRPELIAKLVPMLDDPYATFQWLNTEYGDSYWHDLKNGLIAIGKLSSGSIAGINIDVSKFRNRAIVPTKPRWW